MRKKVPIILILGGMFISVVFAQENSISSNTKMAFVKEQVKCVFANSNEIQRCYNGYGKFGCSGIGVCVADVHGEKGTKQLWTSSCGGYAYTTLDGTSESVEFRCIENSKKIPIVKSRLSVYSKILQQKVKVLHN